MREQRFLRTKAAAAYCGISRSEFSKLANKRQVTYYREPPNGERRFLEADLDAFLAARRVPALKAPTARPPKTKGYMELLPGEPQFGLRRGVERQRV